ncbi:MAG: hydantoinase B/oxoprolinase family protein, partial [Alphaproteobacteria bacterium]
GRDGLSATAFPSGVRNVPVEVNETISPVVIWKKEYRQDSGGAGEFRGGLGQIMEVGTLDDAPFAIAAYYDRIDHPPRGRDGGRNGMAGRVALESGKKLGLGNPRRRAVAAVADDVRQGFISPDAARRDYGVAVNDDGSVDDGETAKLRAVAAE